MIGHSQNINCVAFSPDGKLIVSASGTPRHRILVRPGGQRVISIKIQLEHPSELKVWNATTGEEKLTLNGHTNSVYSVAFHPEGKHIISGSRDGTAKIWDVHTGDELRTITGHASAISTATFSPDGTRIVTGGQNGSLKVWDANDGSELFALERHTNAVEALVFHPDGRRVITGSHDGSIKIWDTALRQAPRTIVTKKGKFRSVGMSPNGRTIVFTDQLGILKRKVRNIWIVDADTLAPLRILQGHRGDITSIAFSRDGLRFVTGSRDKTAKIWDLRSGRQLATLRGHSAFVESVAFSPDGSRIATGSWDNTVKVWDSIAGYEIGTYRGHGGSIYGVAFSPDGKRIASISGRSAAKGNAQNSQLRVWNVNNGKELFAHAALRDTFYHITFSPDGKSIATANRKLLWLWDTETGNELLKPMVHNSEINAVVFSPDGQRIVSAGRNGSITFWETQTGIRIFDLEGHKEKVHSLVFSNDGHRFVSGTRDRTIKIWDAFDAAKWAVMGQKTRCDHADRSMASEASSGRGSEKRFVRTSVPSPSADTLSTLVGGLELAAGGHPSQNECDRRSRDLCPSSVSARSNRFISAAMTRKKLNRT